MNGILPLAEAAGSADEHGMRMDVAGGIGAFVVARIVNGDVGNHHVDVNAGLVPAVE